jgi:hypothetical protein
MFVCLVICQLMTIPIPVVCRVLDDGIWSRRRCRIPAVVAFGGRTLLAGAAQSTSARPWRVTGTAAVCFLLLLPSRRRGWSLLLLLLLPSRHREPLRRWVSLDVLPGVPCLRRGRGGIPSRRHVLFIVEFQIIFFYVCSDRYLQGVVTKKGRAPSTILPPYTRRGDAGPFGFPSTGCRRFRVESDTATTGAGAAVAWFLTGSAWLGVSGTGGPVSKSVFSSVSWI